MRLLYVLSVASRNRLTILSQAIYSLCVSIHVAEALISPPSRFPDIYPVLNVLVSTPVFAFTWLWSIKRGVEVSWALGGVGARPSPATPSQIKHKDEDSSHDGKIQASAQLCLFFILA